LVAPQLTVYLSNLVFFLKPRDLEARLGALVDGPVENAAIAVRGTSLVSYTASGLRLARDELM